MLLGLDCGPLREGVMSLRVRAAAPKGRDMGGVVEHREKVKGREAGEVLLGDADKSRRMIGNNFGKQERKGPLKRKRLKVLNTR